MFKPKYLYLFISLFFLLAFSSNVLAYYPVLLNVNTTQTTFNYYNGFRCVNMTSLGNKVYCFYVGYYGTTGYIYRFNSTFGNQSLCTFSSGAESQALGFTIIDEQTILINYGQAKKFSINQTNFTSGTCVNVSGYLGTGCTQTVTPNWGTWYLADDTYYWGTQGVINNTCGLIAPAYWETNLRPGSNWVYTMMPDRYDNTTIYITTASSSASKNTKIYKYDNGAITNNFQSLEELYGLPTTQWLGGDMIKEGAFIYLYMAWGNLTTLHLYKANWSELVESGNASCNWNNEPLGTICDMNDTSGKTYKVNKNNCNVEPYLCPSGSICSQLTPQVNVSPPLAENYTTCAIRTVLGFNIPCTNICGNLFNLDTPLWSNCLTNDCKHCDPSKFPSWVILPTVYQSPTGASVIVPSYTIHCVNDTTGTSIIVIDEQGNSTNESELIHRYNPNLTCPNTTYQCYNADCMRVACSKGSCPLNTSTTCYDSTCISIPCYTGANSITSLGIWINNITHTPYGSEVIAFIISLVGGLFIFTKTKDKKIEAFIIPFLAFLCGFCLPGVEFFPLWIWLLLTIFTGVLIFWKAKAG